MATTPGKKSFLTRLLLIINQFFILALLLVYLGARINPAQFWPIAFPGLAYPLLLLINLGFVVLWLLQLKPYFLLSLATILLGWGQVQSFFQYNSINKPLPDKGTNISVLSYNVQVFDLYNYGPQWQHNFTRRNQIFQFLEKHDFDIICFQEFVHDKSGSFKTLDTLPTFLGAQNAHTGLIRSSKNINFFGLATFTRYPIVHKGEIRFDTQTANTCIYTDMVINQDTIRVYNVHFESIGLSPEDYLFMENITNTDLMTDRQHLQKGVNILARIRDAFQKRAVQLEQVASHIESSPYPVILAGDFNDTPASWAYRRMTRQLQDSFRSGKGIGQTFIGSLPGFRIDFILHSDTFTPYNFTTGSEKYSDHHPIWVWLNF